MKQYEAVIKTMEENGGYATLGYLYQNVFKIKDCKWGTKTPYASIRRIVQDVRFFFKIKPGLWALKSHSEMLPSAVLPSNETPASERKELDHSYYQGLLVEIGNLKKYTTFIPNQDKNKHYLGKKLGELASIDKFYKFGYEKIIKSAQTIDVSWFNNRNMPSHLFEVEHTTNFQNSLLKFIELQDFNSQIFVVADAKRRRNFEKKLSYNAFAPIAKRVQFMDYDILSNWHTKTAEIANVEEPLKL